MAKIPTQFIPLAGKLAELAAAHPELADMVISVTSKAVERALKSGPTSLAVWQRSFEAASAQFANRKFAQKWTRALTGR